jgi:UDP-glucose 4-epimerase
MRILVTGGAGFIGSNVADRFIEEGHEVAVVDNLSTGFRENINPKARFYEVDICDSKAITEVFDREHPEVVDHHAAQMDVRHSVEDPVFDATTNVLGSLNVILASVKHQVRKFIYISTGGAIYGEPEFLPVTENHPINPESQYGVSKHTVEHYLYLYQHQAGLAFTVLRYPNVYGPRQNPKGEAGVIAIFIGKMLAGVTPTIFGDGEQVRDYVHVNDIVRANSLALVNGKNDVYNIGSGVGTTVNQLYRLLSKILSFRPAPIYAPPRTGELQKIYIDSQKAMKELGWKAEISVEQGLRMTAEWAKGKAVND